MFQFLAWLPVLAEEQPQQPGGGGGFGSMLFPFILIAVVFYFLMIRPQQREQKKREELLGSLKRNDKVVTIGGLLGTIVNISPDGKEVTVKSDDVRLRFQRSAIHSVVRDEGAPDANPTGEKPG